MSHESRFTADQRAQVFSLEAFISIGLLVLVTFIVAPSIATVNYQPGIAEEQTQQHVRQETQELLERHAENGELKRALLYYDDDAYDTGGDWSAASGANVSLISANKYYTDISQSSLPFHKDLEEIETKYNTTINIVFIPESNATSGNEHPERIYYLYQVSPGNTLTTATTTITLYNGDRLMSHPLAHTQHASATHLGLTGNETLTNANHYPIPPGITPPDSNVYNTVTVKLILHKRAEAI